MTDSMMKGKSMFRMKKLKHAALLILMLAAIGQTAFAQHRLKRKADQLYERLSYELAIPYYVRYLEKHDDEESISNLANCYRLTHDYQNAAAWYGKSIDQNQAKAIDYFYYGHALLQIGDTDRARVAFQRYDDLAPDINGVHDPRGKNFLAALKRYDRLMADSALVEISPMPFNTEHPEFGAYPYLDGIVFASARNEGPPVIHDFNWMDEPFLNLYFTHKKKDSATWSKPEFLKGDVNTRYHESNFSQGADSTFFFFSRNSFFDRKKGRDEGGIIKLNLYSGKIEGLKTSKILPFPYNDDNFSVTHPALSADGEVLVFVSDMPGGAGGKDLYMSHKQGAGWSKPENLRAINTPGDEVFPFLHTDGTLYFSSDGHPGLGKLDIFSVRLEGSRQAHNMGYPVNTPHDDFAFYLAPNNEDGFISSNRPGGMGNDDIYAIKIKKPTVEIYVWDAKDKSPIANAEVTVVAGEDDEGLEFETDDYGFVNFFGEYNRDYIAVASQEPYYDGSKSFSTVTQSGQRLFRVDIYLETPPEVITAIVVDDSTGERLPGSKVEFVNRLNRDEVTSLRADRNGRIMVNLESDLVDDLRYELYVTRKGYFSYTIADYDVRRAMQGDTIFPLKVDKIEINKPILLENIHYDFDKWDILSDAYGDLEKVALLMIRNPDLIVELMSHTDCRGNDNYNQRLSAKRATSARLHVILNFGIDPDRIKATGYGESQIANECHDGIFCTEPKHRANRRTEFRVIGYIEGVDMGNSVLETDETNDPVPEIGKDKKDLPPPVLPPFSPGESEELDQDSPPLDPANWPTPEKSDKDNSSSSNSDPAPDKTVFEKVETVPVVETTVGSDPVSELIGDSQVTGLVLPDRMYNPNATAEGTTFRVRIGAFKGELSPASRARLGKFQPYLLKLASSSGLNAYYIGEYNTAKSALRALEQVKECGYFGAYLTGFEGGEELSLGKLRERIGK